MHGVPHGPTHIAIYVIAFTSNHLERYRHRNLHLVEIGHVINKRPITAGVDEAKPRRTPQSLFLPIKLFVSNMELPPAEDSQWTLLVALPCAGGRVRPFPAGILAEWDAPAWVRGAVGPTH